MFGVDDKGNEVEIFDNMESREEEIIELQKAEVVNAVKLSLDSMMRFSSPGTLKMKGMIENEVVIVLIDCGATYNFLAQKLVEELKLPLVETMHPGVIMGKGSAAKGKGMCRVVLTIGELMI